MIENEKEGRRKIREFMEAIMANIDMTEAEKQDCIEECPDYLRSVIFKAIKREKSSDEYGCMRMGVLGFIGGYAARHLYSLKPKNENN